MKKKILFILQTAKRGGAEISLIELLKQIKNDISEDSTILFLEKGIFLEKDLPIQKELVEWDIPIKRTFPYFSFSINIKNTNKIVKMADDYDIIWTNGQKAHILGYFLKKKTNTKWIVHFRDILSPLQMFFLKYILKNADKIISTSEYVFNNLLPIQSEVIYNGFFLKGYRDIKPMKLEKPAIGMIANWQAGKGIEDLIRIAQRKKEWNFYIIGDSLFSNKRYKLPQNITHLGYMDNIGPFLKSLDIGLVLSYKEGFGRVCVEMAIANIPIIAYDTGIHKKITPFICSIGDIECVEKYIEKILDGIEFSYALNEFDIEYVANRILNMIK